MGVPNEVVEYRPDFDTVFLRQLRYLFVLFQIGHVLEVEGFRDVLGDVVDGVGVAFHLKIIVGESVDVDEFLSPNEALGVPILQVLELQSTECV